MQKNHTRAKIQEKHGFFSVPEKKQINLLERSSTNDSVPEKNNKFARTIFN